MKELVLSAAKVNTETIVSNIFIDKYMRDSNGEFVKVYLCLLRCMGIPGITLSGIADRLNLTEKDVIRALKYWDKQKVLSVTFTSATEPESIIFLPLCESEQAAVVQSAATVEAVTATVNPTVVNHSDSNKSSDSPVKTSYSPSQLRRFKDQEDIKELLFIVEQYIGTALTGADINSVLYIYNDLHFSIDLIEYLVEYCVTNRHTSLRYIEKVALAWHEQGIKSINDAKDAAVIHNKRTLAVSKAFGFGDRTLTPIEMEFINRWYDEFGFDSEIIVAACQRTILTMGKPNFNYANKILSGWKEANVHTLEDIKPLDNNFRAKITVPVGTKQPPVKATNKFNNFSQRSYDFEQMEKNLISNNR